MATECCCIPSITEVLCIYLLGNHEIRLYRTCQAIFISNQVRREWWQHVQVMNCLAYHMTPGRGQRSWNCFIDWRDCIYGGVLAAYPDNASLEDYHWPDGLESASHSSYSSCPDHPPDDSASECSDDSHNIVFDWLTGFGPRGGPPCNRCRQLPSVVYGEVFDLICHRCHQADTNFYLIAHWSMIYHTHPLLNDIGITRHVAEFLWGDGLSKYCSCGECNPNWFLRGWVCYDCN